MLRALSGDAMCYEPCRETTCVKSLVRRRHVLRALSGDAMCYEPCRERDSVDVL